MSQCSIRRLTPADASAFQSLRLAALVEAPTAFGSSYEEEKGFTTATVEERLAHHVDRGVFGAFDADRRLIGVVALGREGMRKLSHKAMIWGLFVAPQTRGRGVARALLTEAMTLARGVEGLRQINLCVNAANAGAIGLYESLGFEAFGHERGAMLIDGVLHDELHLSVLLQRGATG